MPTSWTPLVEAVAARIPARLGGSDVFTDDTVPTLVQAEEVIDQAVRDIIGTVGSFDPAAVINPVDVDRGETPVTLGDLAAAAASLDAASQIELGFFPEQVADGPYAELNERAKAALLRLERAVVEHSAGGVVAGRGSPKPRYSFPEACW